VRSALIAPLAVFTLLGAVVACAPASETDEQVTVKADTDGVGTTACRTGLCYQAPTLKYEPPPPPPPTYYPPPVFGSSGSFSLEPTDPEAGSVVPDSCGECHWNATNDACECPIGNGYVFTSSVSCPAAYPYPRTVLGRVRCYQSP
jgi:hypothetical protein